MIDLDKAFLTLQMIYIWIFGKTGTFADVK